jgi:hypothetical protein
MEQPEQLGHKVTRVPGSMEQPEQLVYKEIRD